jgi:polysaccharide biosynthesis/export protein
MWTAVIVVRTGREEVGLMPFQHKWAGSVVRGPGFGGLPLVGEFKAEGLTTSELEDEIETRLKEDHFLVGPQVSLQVQTYRPFYVLGEFANPGSYEYRDGMTVAEALAVAGGNTYRRTHQV